MAYEIKRQYMEDPSRFESTGQSIYDPDHEDDMHEGLHFDDDDSEPIPAKKAHEKEQEEEDAADSSLFKKGPWVRGFEVWRIWGL